MHAQHLLLALLPLASATPLLPRAGGPSYVPIPANCTITNPLLSSNTTSPSNSTTTSNSTTFNSRTGLIPPLTFLAAHQIYSIYLSQPDFQSPQQRYTGCLEQCNGLSTCSSIILGYDVPTPAGYYGTKGGVPSVACWFFDAYLDGVDWVEASAGTWVNETAGEIWCPAS